MSIKYTNRSAKFDSFVGIEEADGLLEWIKKHTKGKINLGNCEHIHSANLQVLMTMRPGISVWPKDQTLKGWLKVALDAN